MKLDTFFEKFDQFADAPDSVLKMREIILMLAVQGRLVPHDAQGVTAAQELDHLGLGIFDFDPRFDIPANWVWAPLEPLLSLMKNGFNGKPNKLGGHYKVTRIETIARGTIDLSRVGFADDLPVEVVEKHLIRNGDILFSHINSEPHLGKTAICTFDDLKLIHGVNLLLLRTKPQIAPQFLNIALKELRVAGYFVSIAQRAINQSSINQKNLGKILIPVPPLAEQKRIVAKVDELMALCDRLESQQRERETKANQLARASLARFAEAPTPANLQYLFHKSYDIAPADIRKSILTLAVQGKLVEPNSIEESVDNVLEQMQKRRKQLIDAKKIRKIRDFPPVAEDETPFSVPAGWRWTRWGQICDWITYGFTRPMAHVDKGPPIITAKNVQDGFMIFGNAHHADATEFADLNPKDLPRKGDILITKDGTIGRAAIVDTDEPFCINQSVAVLWLETCLLYRPFMLMVIRSPFAQGPIWDAAEGMAIKHLSITDFGNMILPLPPLAEQRRIVEKVEQLMALVDALELQLAASRTAGAALLEAMLAQLTNATAM